MSDDVTISIFTLSYLRKIVVCFINDEKSELSLKLGYQVTDLGYVNAVICSS